MFDAFVLQNFDYASVFFTRTGPIENFIFSFPKDISPQILLLSSLNWIRSDVAITSVKNTGSNLSEIVISLVKSG